MEIDEWDSKVPQDHIPSGLAQDIANREKRKPEAYYRSTPMDTIQHKEELKRAKKWAQKEATSTVKAEAQGCK